MAGNKSVKKSLHSWKHVDFRLIEILYQNAVKVLF